MILKNNFETAFSKTILEIYCDGSALVTMKINGIFTEIGPNGGKNLMCLMHVFSTLCNEIYIYQ